MSFSLDTSSRTPLKDVSNRESSASVAANYSATKMQNISCSYQPNPNMDLIHSKIEHLEKDRVELTLQLHRRDERERDRKFQMAQMEKSLKAAQEEARMAQAQRQAAKDELKEVTSQMNILETENAKLRKDSANAINAQTSELWNRMTAANRELKRVEEESTEIKQQSEIIKHESEALKTELSRLTAELEGQKGAIHNLHNQLASSADKMSQLELALQQERALGVEKDALLSSHEGAAQSLREEITQCEACNNDLSSEVAQLKLVISQLKDTNKEQNVYSADNDKDELLAAIKDLTTKLVESERQRSVLHNKVQELRGNIRVYVRCRPFLTHDAASAEASSSISCHKDGQSLSIEVANAANKIQNFSFDKIFQSQSSQKDVYNEVSDLVQSALDGYRVCIFSYGQTGSGKTWTMTGDMQSRASVASITDSTTSGIDDNRGVIPRSMQAILEKASNMQHSGWTTTVSVSIVEIYNETLRDLLVPPQSVTATLLAKQDKKDPFKIVKQGNRVIVAGLNNTNIDSANPERGMQQFTRILEQSNAVRATAATGMNSESSRSHQIVMVDIAAKHVDGVTVMQGALRLCDLAGSERLDRTGTASDAARLKETVNINKSLSCLADVFLALSSKQSHVPYRNSKLTMLLQDCLSGDGKALMFVNVSPTVASSQESLCSLRFANQVSQVELGKASKQMYTLQQAQPSSSSSSSSIAAAAAAVSDEASGSSSINTTNNNNSGGGSSSGVQAVSTRSSSRRASISTSSSSSGRHHHQSKVPPLPVSSKDSGGGSGSSSSNRRASVCPTTTSSSTSSSSSSKVVADKEEQQQHPTKRARTAPATSMTAVPVATVVEEEEVKEEDGNEKAMEAERLLLVNEEDKNIMTAAISKPVVTSAHASIVSSAPHQAPIVKAATVTVPAVVPVSVPAAAAAAAPSASIPSSIAGIDDARVTAATAAAAAADLRTYHMDDITAPPPTTSCCGATSTAAGDNKLVNKSISTSLGPIDLLVPMPAATSEPAAPVAASLAATPLASSPIAAALVNTSSTSSTAATAAALSAAVSAKESLEVEVPSKKKRNFTSLSLEEKEESNISAAPTNVHVGATATISAISEANATTCEDSDRMPPPCASDNDEDEEKEEEETAEDRKRKPSNLMASSLLSGPATASVTMSFISSSTSFLPSSSSSSSAGSTSATLHQYKNTFAFSAGIATPSRSNNTSGSSSNNSSISSSIISGGSALKSGCKRKGGGLLGSSGGATRLLRHTASATSAVATTAEPIVVGSGPGGKLTLEEKLHNYNLQKNSNKLLATSSTGTFSAGAATTTTTTATTATSASATTASSSSSSFLSNLTSSNSSSSSSSTGTKSSAFGLGSANAGKFSL